MKILEKIKVNVQNYRIKFNDIAEEWLAQKENEIKQSTYANYRYLINKYLIPELGKLSVKKLEEYNYNQFIRDSIENLSSKEYSESNEEIDNEQNENIANNNEQPLSLEHYTLIDSEEGGKVKRSSYAKDDIDLKDFIIEFDEENHFNRYRLKTLNSLIYKDWKNFKVADYQQYCTKYEDKCCAYGKFWRTDSSDNQYEMSSPNGVLDGIGSSRWKQRAFYDFVKDVYSIVINTPIIRISIYDIYHAQTILSLIQQERETELMQYIKNRVNCL